MFHLQNVNLFGISGWYNQTSQLQLVIAPKAFEYSKIWTLAKIVWCWLLEEAPVKDQGAVRAGFQSQLRVKWLHSGQVTLLSWCIISMAELHPATNLAAETITVWCHRNKEIKGDHQNRASFPSRFSWDLSPEQSQAGDLLFSHTTFKQRI